MEKAKTVTIAKSRYEELLEMEKAFKKLEWEMEELQNYFSSLVDMTKED